MISNLAFHVGSLFAFLGLLYWVITLKESLAFSRFISRNSNGFGERVVVDWPLRFIKRLACELGIDAHFDVKTSSGKPLKIQTLFWIRALRDMGVQSIQASYAGNKALNGQRTILLRFTVINSADHNLIADMQKFLGQDIKLEIRPSQE